MLVTGHGMPPFPLALTLHVVAIAMAVLGKFRKDKATVLPGAFQHVCWLADMQICKQSVPYTKA